MEHNDGPSDVHDEIIAQRLKIDRIRFAMPSGGMSTMDFSLVTALCIAGGGDGKLGTHLPDDTEIEVQIRTTPGESG